MEEELKVKRCPNCGALVDGPSCVYCGTTFVRSPQLNTVLGLQFSHADVKVIFEDGKEYHFYPTEMKYQPDPIHCKKIGKLYLTLIEK